MKLYAVALGYNDLHVTIGVFESRRVAEEKLVEFGAEWKAFPIWKAGKPTKELSKPRLVTNKKFVEYMESKDLSTYSTGAGLEENWIFEFIPIELNEICIGYNDD